MATGFVQRFKGKVVVVFGGIWQGGGQAAGYFLNAGVPVNGTSGTLANIAPKGALLVDTTNAVLYQNTNTKASPTWSGVPITGVAAITSGTIAGATIDSSAIGGTTPAAGAFTTLVNTGLRTGSMATGITASATHTIAGGTALVREFNRVTTVAGAGDAVTLAALVAGQYQIVFNDGAAAAGVYPNAAGVSIDGGGAGAPVTLTNGKRAIFWCTAANVIESAQLGVASA